MPTATAPFFVQAEDARRRGAAQLDQAFERESPADARRSV